MEIVVEIGVTHDIGEWSSSCQRCSSCCGGMTGQRIHRYLKSVNAINQYCSASAKEDSFRSQVLFKLKKKFSRIPGDGAGIRHLLITLTLLQTACSWATTVSASSCAERRNLATHEHDNGVQILTDVSVLLHDALEGKSATNLMLTRVIPAQWVSRS